jgi:hypothetical protein
VVLQNDPSNLGRNKIENLNLSSPAKDLVNVSITAQTITLDDILPYVKTKYVIMKIDVESYECNVINSGKRLFEEKDGSSKNLFARISLYNYSCSPTRNDGVAVPVGQHDDAVHSVHDRQIGSIESVPIDIRVPNERLRYET